jgi:hypothetical protein
MAQFKARITSYSEAAQFLGERNYRKVAHNTAVERKSGDYIAVRLHGTDVVGFHADGRIVLRSGGWETVTTKDRINQCLPRPWGVTQRDFAWTLDRLTNKGADEYGNTVWDWEPSEPFRDGMVIHTAA